MFLSILASAAIITCPVLSVIDGDTFEIPLYCLPKDLTLKVRIYGVDTPEKGGRANCKSESDLGEAATQYSKEQLTGKKVVLSNIQWDKFGGRIDAKVNLKGKDYSSELIKNGYAREYYGDKKKSWCD